MNARYISFTVGIIFFVLSYVVKKTIDINFQDTYYIIDFAFVFKLIAFFAFFVSVILSFKNKNANK
jgi:hypothetical protein